MAAGFSAKTVACRRVGTWRQAASRRSFSARYRQWPRASRRFSAGCWLVLLVLSGCHVPQLHPASNAEPLHIGGAGLASPESNSQADAVDEAPALYHQVRPGEELSDIAAAYGMGVPRLLQSNGLDTGAPLKPGQLIYIPPSR